MYAPTIYGDVTITVTGTVASNLIKRAQLGEHRDDCWLLRDGKTTIVAKEALTDALVAIAEEPAHEALPSARPETPASQRVSHEARTSTKGHSLLCDFLLKALDHDAVIDEVIEVLYEHVEIQRRSPGAIADDLRSIIYRAVGEASVEDWSWVTDTLIADACEALGIEYPLPERTPPGVESPRQPKRRTRALRSLDPGELREKLASIYARDATSHGARRGARWIVRHISRLTGLPREQIEADARADAEAIDELVHVAGDDRVSPGDRGSVQTAAPASGSCWPLRRLSQLEGRMLLVKREQSRDAVTRTRCGVILAANAGVSPARLAATHLMSVADITRIICEFNEHGISSVEGSQ
jgi:hypothetical protein